MRGMKNGVLGRLLPEHGNTIPLVEVINTSTIDRIVSKAREYKSEHIDRPMIHMHLHVQAFNIYCGEAVERSVFPVMQEVFSWIAIRCCSIAIIIYSACIAQPITIEITKPTPRTIPQHLKVNNEPLFIHSKQDMNRYSSSDRKHTNKRNTDERGPSQRKRQTNYKSIESSRATDNDEDVFLRTVSKDDSLGPRFEPPIKKQRPEGRDDVESSAVSQRNRGRQSTPYRNPTMKSYNTIEQLIIGAFQNRSALVSSSLAAFWTRAASLLEEDADGKSSLHNTQHLMDKVNYMLQRTEDTLEEFGSNNMSQTLTAMGKIVKQGQGRKGSILSDIRGLLVGRGVARQESIFLKIANVAVHKLDRYDPQALSTTAITFARIGIAPTLNDGSNLFDCIAFYAMKRMRSFNPQGLSTLVWAFATVQVSHTPLFKMVADAALASLHLFNPQNLSNTAWAFAKVNQSHPRLFRRISLESQKYIASPESVPQNISNLLWSFATAEIYDEELFEVSAQRIINLGASDFCPQELANSLSAFASANISNHALFKTIGDEAIRQLTSFIPQNLSNMVHAFATAGISHSSLFDKIAKEAMPRLAEFNSQEIANLAWSYAKAKEIEPKLFHRIAKESLERLDDFVEPQHLSNTIWAFATSRLLHKPLFDAVSAVVIKRKHEFSPQQLSNLIWSYSFIGYVDQNLCRCLESVVFKSISNCDSQFFPNIAWSYAVANVDAPFLFGKNSQFIRAILSRQQEFNLEALCQLHQFILWRKELKAEMPFPSSFQQLCYDAYIAREPTPSAFQDFVMAELKSIGLEAKEEFLTSCGYSLDALVKVNGEQVGIEVDGPFHFAGRGQALGKFTLKHRQLWNVEGIRIVSVPYWEWEGTVDKQEYLRAKLDMHEDNSYDEFRWVL